MAIEVEITWDGNDIIGRDSHGNVLGSLRDQEPIDARTDSWLIAGYMADAIGAELEAVAHDGEYIHAVIAKAEGGA